MVTVNKPPIRNKNITVWSSNAATTRIHEYNFIIRYIFQLRLPFHCSGAFVFSLNFEWQTRFTNLERESVKNSTYIRIDFHNKKCSTKNVLFHWNSEKHSSMAPTAFRIIHFTWRVLLVCVPCTQPFETFWTFMVAFWNFYANIFPSGMIPLINQLVQCSHN